MESDFTVTTVFQGRCNTFAYSAVVISPRVIANIATFGREGAIVATRDGAAPVLIGRVGAVIVDEVRFSGDRIAVFVGTTLSHATPLVGHPVGSVVGIVITAAYDKTFVILCTGIRYVV